jgi:hypothetical protein
MVALLKERDGDMLMPFHQVGAAVDRLATTAGPDQVTAEVDRAEDAEAVPDVAGHGRVVATPDAADVNGASNAGDVPIPMPAIAGCRVPRRSSPPYRPVEQVVSAGYRYFGNWA